jgi:hypothetical protein
LSVIFPPINLGICACSCIVGTVFVILGFSSLEAIEYGLDYSWISKTVKKLK